jgi:pilus assembly protein CpaB
MLSRKLLFTLGGLALLAATLLSALWIYGTATPKVPVATQLPTQWILVAAHAIPAGTLLRAGDITWGEVPAAEVVGADILRGSTTGTDYVGAVTRRAYAAREPLTPAELVSPGDPDFLVAALRPGFRAVSISVDAAQSASGLVSPGDRIDIVLTQAFSGQGTDASRKSVGETVLHDLRVIAVDQTLTPPAKVTAGAPTDMKIPKTVTLEVTERQAQMLLVAEQLGKIQLTLRGEPHRGAAQPLAGDAVAPTWASDVSPALASPAADDSTAQRVVVDVMHGGKTERVCQTPAGFITCP